MPSEPIDPSDGTIGLGYLPDELLSSPALPLWPDEDGLPGQA